MLDIFYKFEQNLGVIIRCLLMIVSDKYQNKNLQYIGIADFLPIFYFLTILKLTIHQK